MKLYTYNCGWRGCLVCVANSKDEAIEKFKHSEAYCLDDEPVEKNEHLIDEYELDEVLDVGGDY